MLSILFIAYIFIEKLASSVSKKKIKELKKQKFYLINRNECCPFTIILLLPPPLKLLLDPVSKPA